MAILISIDNDRTLSGIQQVTLDESAGIQNTVDANNAAGDPDDDVEASYFDGADIGTNLFSSSLLDPTFRSFINALFTTNTTEDGALAYAATARPAASSANFIQITATAGETVNNLFFSIDPSNPTGLISSVTTLANEALYFHIDTNTDIATLTTSADGTGRVVAAFYLKENTTTHLTAEVEMVTFEALKHPDGTNADDAINFTDVLRVSAAGSLAFTFANLPSGNFLYAAFGNTTAAMLVTGDNLAVSHDPNASDYGKIISNSSDTVNTSQAAKGNLATIGINSQHFTYGGSGQNKTDGSTSDFTFVSGLVPLQGTAGMPATGTNVQDIDYGGYINTVGAGLTVSQLTGGNAHADMRISLWRAGGGTTPEEGFSYIDNSFTNEAVINDDSALHDDILVQVGEVKVVHGNTTIVWGGSSAGHLNFGDTHAATGIKVALSDVFAPAGNDSFQITGLGSLDQISWTAANGETFNRFKLTALATTSAFDLGGVNITEGTTVSAPVGSQLILDDDGPSITASAVNAPTLTVDETTLATDASAGFAAQFTPSYGADGQAATPVTYALSTPGGASGLVDTATGQNVVLSLNGTVIEGRTAVSNALVFTVSVSASGLVTLDQQRAIVHPTADPDESKSLSAANLVVLTATAHDKDNDVASAPLNIGQLLVFKDDGPSITASAVNAPTLTVDETTLATDASAGFAAQFTPSYGADGQAATPVTYALSTPGGASGLVDTATGQNVVLSLNGTVIEGRTAVSNALVFTVSVSASGLVTLDQQRAIVHPTADPDESKSLSAANLVVLTATAHDKDNDVASAPLNIGQLLVFKDDGPSITASAVNAPTLTVDETTLATDASASFAAQFTPAYGADGQAATPVTYALSTPGGASGLVDTATGQNVVLSLNGTVIEGRTAVSNALVFTVSVSASGLVTLDQQRAIVHPTADPDESKSLSAANLVVLTATAHDKDNDVASAPLNIGQLLVFKDDGPNASGTAQTATIDEDGVVVGTGNTGGPGDDAAAAKTANGSVSAIFNLGADGLGSYSLSNDPVQIALLPQLTSQGGTVLYDVNGNILTAYVNGAIGGYTSADDREVFTLTLDGATGAYTFELLDQLDHPATNGGTLETAIAFEDELTLNLGAILKVADKDGDTAIATANKLVITADDDSPVITTLDSENDIAYANAKNPTPGGDGKFAYSIGLDDRDSYSAAASDFVLSLTGNVGGTAITSPTVTWQSESDAQATFSFSFSYLANPTDLTSNTTANGTLSFDKSLGTYHVSLTAPISSFTVLSTNDPNVGFTGYLANTDTVTGSQPPVSTAALASNFFVQFSGFQESGGGTDGNGTLAQNKNLDALAPGDAWNTTADDSFVAGDLFSLRMANPNSPPADIASLSWVSVSGSAAGVAGDTMQAGEVLDFNLFNGDPKGFANPLAPVAKTSASTIFMEFDGLDNGEDLVVVLKLVDQSNPALTTTRAVIVEYGDIFHKAEQNLIPASFGFTGTLDNNDGLVVIESNDYNVLANDHWMIQGAQVLASTEGISGTGVNLTRAIGSGGGSPSTFQNFGTTQDSGQNTGGTWDGDVFKITNIGFLTANTQTADTELNFGVQIVDFDGDKTAAQTISVDILGNQSAALAGLEALQHVMIV